MLHIETLTAIEILDSRARPTLAVTVVLPGGVTAGPACPRGPRPARERPASCATATLPASRAWAFAVRSAT